MQCAGTVTELILMDGLPAARIVCDPEAIPGPGQYALACEEAANVVVASVIFAARRSGDGFVAEPPAPAAWRPGARLALRGPLGHGFTLPAAARRIALIAWDGTRRSLLALAEQALLQGAAVTFVSDDPPYDLPLAVEVQPRGALAEACRWSDYAAFDVRRESLEALLHGLAKDWKTPRGGDAEALIRTPMPCGGIADCGVCTVKTRRGPRLACVDGPVLDLQLLLSER